MLTTIRGPGAPGTTLAECRLVTPGFLADFNVVRNSTAYSLPHTPCHACMRSQSRHSAGFKVVEGHPVQEAKQPGISIFAFHAILELISRRQFMRQQPRAKPCEATRDVPAADARRVANSVVICA